MTAITGPKIEEYILKRKEEDPTRVLRADRVVLKVPRRVQSKGPHVFEKLSMMAGAVAEGMDDEAAFMENMRGGIWREAQAVIASGKF